MPHLRTIHHVRRAAAVAGAVAVIVAGSLAFAAPAYASGKTSAGGDFSATVNGTTYNPAAGKDVKLASTAVSGTIAVRGRNVGFDINVATLGVYNYTLTGAPDTQRMVTKPTVVFASKVPTLTAAQKSGTKIKSLEIKDDNFTVRFSMAGGTYTVQAKDGAQGGIFQIEPEFATAVEMTHTLGADLFYFVNPFTGKVNLGNATDAVTSAADPVNYHQLLIGKDSPQVATKTFQSGSVSKWSVAPGGRMGGVLGEDGIEITAGASNCTSKCQAQEQIRGSLPIPPVPADPTPIGG